VGLKAEQNGEAKLH